MEGPWTGPMLGKVAGHVVDLEEVHFHRALKRSSRIEPAAEVPPSNEHRQPPSNPPDLVLPEFCRFHCVEFHLPGKRESNISTLILSRFRHELGKAGGWCITKCDVELPATTNEGKFIGKSVSILSSLSCQGASSVFLEAKVSERIRRGTNNSASCSAITSQYEVFLSSGHLPIYVAEGFRFIRGGYSRWA